MTQRELIEKIKAAIPVDSIGRYDLLRLFAEADLFSEIVKFFADKFIGKFDYIASPEATGWVLGAALARALNIGFIALRREEKLPYPPNLITSAKYLDYSGSEKSLGLATGSLKAGSKALIVDEWIETGASVRCCIELLEKENCIVSGIATVGINYTQNTNLWIDTGFVSFICMDI